jgi:flagellar basal body-associated protein FliL
MAKGSKGSNGSKVSKVFNIIIYVVGIVSVCLLIGFIVWRFSCHKNEETGANVQTLVQTVSSTSEVMMEKTQDIPIVDIGEFVIQETLMQ